MRLVTGLLGSLSGVSTRRCPQGLLTGHISVASLVKSEASLNCLLILQSRCLAQWSSGTLSLGGASVLRFAVITVPEENVRTDPNCLLSNVDLTIPQTTN